VATLDDNGIELTLAEGSRNFIRLQAVNAS
jgi:hypothetical protein